MAVHPVARAAAVLPAAAAHGSRGSLDNDLLQPTGGSWGVHSSCSATAGRYECGGCGRQAGALALVQHDANLWSAEHEFGWQGGLIRIPVRMTVIRLDHGQLILHSPVPISAELRSELDALGPVGFIVVPETHGRFAAEVSQLYPSARLLAAPKASRRRRRLPFDGSLADQVPAEWAGQVDSLLLLGFRLHEVVLLHRPSRTLVLSDLCFHIQRSSSALARTFFRANGMWQHFGPSRIIRRAAVSDRAALGRSLERVLKWDFERIIPGHGDVIEHGGPAALSAAWPG
jgi:hypothetical protein